MAVHAMLLAWTAAVNSPTVDEPAHLAAGISHWKTGRFDLYRVNPPLVRMIAAVPVLFSDARIDWVNDYDASVYARSEFTLGSRFLAENGAASWRYFTWARWALIPVCLAGGWFSFRWACALFDWRAGLVATTLYSFCPSLIAMGALITPDAPAAALGVVAGYAFWRWLDTPGWSRAALAGLALGIAELSKTTWIILFILWPLLWFVVRIRSRRSPALDSGGSGLDPGETAAAAETSDECAALRSAPLIEGRAFDDRFREGTLVRPTRSLPTLAQLGTILGLGLYVMNLGFGFEGSFAALGDYRFISRILSGAERPPQGGNRFSGTWLAAIPVPLPENYIRGIDVQRFDFEQKKWSYLRGELRFGGWWHYYIDCALVKTPVGSLAILALGLLVPCLRNRRTARRLDYLLLLTPAIAVFILVSSQTGFSRYYRYVLPALPLCYIAAGSVCTKFLGRRTAPTATVLPLLILSSVESLAVVPHSLAFFNGLAGGPREGHRHLLDANLDWGQDLLQLKRWCDNHAESRPLHLAYFDRRFLDPRIAGIDFVEMSLRGKVHESDAGVAGGGTVRREPGWYAVSVNCLYGYRHLTDDEPAFTDFQEHQPEAQAGYSIYIYHLPADEQHASRRAGE